MLAEFISEGHFERHLRRMPALYQERQRVLVEEAQRHLTGLLELAPTGAGLQCVGWLAHDLDEHVATRAAAAREVDVTPLSRFALRALRQPGLLLSFGAFSPEQIRSGVQRLAHALNEVRAGRYAKDRQIALRAAP